MRCLWIFVTAFAAPFGVLAADVENGAVDKCAELLAEWRKPGAAHDEEHRYRLFEAAILTERPGVINDFAAGGDAAKMEIPLQGKAQRIEASVVRNLGMPAKEYGNPIPWVIRRMTKTHFEVWTPKHGWLFDSKGVLINEAFPPRRDGAGREWHGAFLPDGRWVTTDLWAYDRTLTFFSARGKWVKEMSAETLAPLDKGDDRHESDLIGWARCDREGRGWVVSIGSNGGSAIVFVGPSGPARALSGHLEPWDMTEPWRLCYPRDLEPKGTYVSLFRPSDDGEAALHFGEAGHGNWVGFPTYSWGGHFEEGSAYRKVIPDGDHDFGFLPSSHDVFIGASNMELNDEPDSAEDQPEGRGLKTWFFGAAGNCRGWVRGAYLADSADGQAVWFLDDRNGVVVLGNDLRPQTRMRFVIAGTGGQPRKLFPDLRLGLFRVRGKLVLARW